MVKTKKIQNEKTISTPFAVIKYAETKEDKSRFGFIVSKKIDKRAVVRNEVKRRIRSVIEKEFLNLEKPVEIIFIIRKEAIDMDFREISAILEKVFKKEGLIK